MSYTENADNSKQNSQPFYASGPSHDSEFTLGIN